MAPDPRSRPSGDRCGVPDPELLRDDGAPRRAARHRRRPAAPSAKDHPHAMNGAGRHAVAAATVFDGAVLHRDHAVIIEDSAISGLVPTRDLPGGLPVHHLPDGAWLAPGFIDVQVNGGGDVLFNDTPTVEGIAAIVAAPRRFGTTALLPTLISDTADKMRAAGAPAEAALPSVPGVLGIHFEGPFLSPERAGVHDPAMLRPPTSRDLKFLTKPRAGVTLVTLSPERMPQGFVADLA